MPNLGKIEEFNPASTNTNRYLERKLGTVFYRERHSSRYRRMIQTQSNPRAKAKSHLTTINITALLNALVAEKQATHIPSANTGTIHAIPVGDRVISQMHASLNVRRSTCTVLKSQKRLNSTPLRTIFSLRQRAMASKYPLN